MKTPTITVSVYRGRVVAVAADQPAVTVQVLDWDEVQRVQVQEGWAARHKLTSVRKLTPYTVFRE